MTDKLDDLSGIPRYLQVARVIEYEIQSGSWEIGDPIESRKRLAGRFGIAEMTAARAHQWLAERGYVVAVPGVGMVVTPRERWKPDPPTS
jgi:GntR family transcriptional regulator